jgi:apolipoprotein N-acyltransferase
MKKINWREIFVRLTSRKFLLVLGGVIIAIANSEWNTVIALVLGYLGVEGTADIISRKKE